MNALYSLYDALVSINVPSDKARAVVDAMERDMTAILATKDDLKQLGLATRADLKLLDQRIDSSRVLLEQKIDTFRVESRTELHHEIALLRSWMIIRLGSMQIAGIALLFTALKLTG